MRSQWRPAGCERETRRRRLESRCSPPVRASPFHAPAASPCQAAASPAAASAVWGLCRAIDRRPPDPQRLCHMGATWDRWSTCDMWAARWKGRGCFGEGAGVLERARGWERVGKGLGKGWERVGK
eukprot:6960430-Prymnesium_polylepis.1